MDKGGVLNKIYFGVREDQQDHFQRYQMFIFIYLFIPSSFPTGLQKFTEINIDQKFLKFGQ